MRKTTAMKSRARTAAKTATWEKRAGEQEACSHGGTTACVTVLRRLLRLLGTHRWSVFAGLVLAVLQSLRLRSGQPTETRGPAESARCVPVQVRGTLGGDVSSFPVIVTH